MEGVADPVISAFGEHIGWTLDPWRARCVDWAASPLIPSPDYYHQLPQQTRHRIVCRPGGPPSKPAIPHAEYNLILKFIDSVKRNARITDWILTMPNCPQIPVLDDDKKICWRLSKGHFTRFYLPLIDDGITSADIDRWCNKIVRNDSNSIRTISAFGDLHYMPPKSSFFMSDISYLNRMFEETPSFQNKFQLIMIDPPWDNKSVQRSKAYPTLRHSIFLDMPIDKLLDRQDGLVAIWVTNDYKYRSFICDELFPRWGVQFHSVWYWLKLVSASKPFEYIKSGLDSPHQKPYEQLIFGFSKAMPISTITLPKSRILVSYLESHSRKPVLDSIIDKYLPPGAHKMELFARDLKSSWFSWGNEPLRFQKSSRFQKQRVIDSSGPPATTVE